MKVLIVDDEALVRRSLRRAFESIQFTVVEAEDGEMGLTLWRQENPNLVILDVLMPGLTGPQVLKEIGIANRAKVILISAYTGEYDLNRAQVVGADLFISKPFQNIFDVVKVARDLLNE